MRNDARLVDALGVLYDVEITDSIEYDLIGRVVSAPSSKKNPSKKAPLLSVVS